MGLVAYATTCPEPALMIQPSVLEQYMLELVNAARAKVGSQPLAFNLNLNQAAEDHSQWMLATDEFSHTGAGGSQPDQRMSAAGYGFSGFWNCRKAA